MKAKLLQNAGNIPRGAEVDVVAKVNADTAEGDREPNALADTSPVYAVKDEQNHEERVDTRDLRPLP